MQIISLGDNLHESPFSGKSSLICRLLKFVIFWIQNFVGLTLKPYSEVEKKIQKYFKMLSAN